MRTFYTHYRLSSLLMLLFVAIGSAWGQSSTPALSRFDRRVVPPSPEATQLGVFGNVLPDLNSGAVQLNVPLPTAKGRQLSLPLSLNYHYTGLQVGELPSWVGLGWTLSSGGVITRTIQGLPDEKAVNGYTRGGWQQLRLLRNRPAGSLQIHYSGQQQVVAPDIPLKNLCQQVLRNEWDTEPDSYSISTPFYSGKLFVDSLGAITCSPHADVTISGGPDSGWTVQAGDGTQYVYQAPEINTPSDELQTPYGQAATAWYLSEIISADGSDHIYLVYGTQESGITVPINSVVKKVFSKSRIGSPCDSRQLSYKSPAGVSTGAYPLANTTTSSPYLVHIITATTDIEFVSDTARRDVARSYDRSVRRLTRIVYREPVSGTVKADFTLTHGYFNASSSNPKERRLRLDAVRQVGKPSYRFSYEGSQPMPSRDSYAKDHWGYYNGQVQNRTLIPSIPTYLLSMYGDANFQGSIRTANGTAARLGALREVQYPTGGRTTFDYEPNSASKDCRPPTLAEQFGDAQSVNCTMLRVMANGGNFSMDANELRFQAEHGGGRMDGTTLPSNVRVQTIDATDGFYMCDMEWNGNNAIPTIPGSTTNCNVGYEYVRTSLWSAEYDSLSHTYGATTLLCQVAYTASRCATTMTSTCGSRIAQSYPPGKYMLVAEVSASNPASIWASIGASIYLLPSSSPPVANPNSPPQAPCYLNVQVGGIRLRQATDWTAAGQATTKTFRYCAAGQPKQSSGHLFVLPKYSYENACGDLIVGASDAGKDSWLDVGYHVGYGRVEVETQGRQAGTTVYYYRNLEGELPAARNLVTKMEELSQTGSLVKETTNEYRLMRTSTVPGFRLYEHYNDIGTLQSPGGYAAGQSIMDAFLWLDLHPYTAYWPQLITTTERVAGTGASGAMGLPSRTIYHYLPKAPGRTTQPVRTARYLSDGRQLITKTLYCGQYNPTTQTLSGPALGIQELATRNMIGVPVEHQAWQRLGGDSSVVGGDLTHFAQGRPRRILALATAAPIPASQFVSSYIQGTTLEQDARYIERVAFPRYSAAGNPLEQQVTAAAPNSYLWGYNETQLIAEVKGAALRQVAYTSFEDSGMGSFVYNPMTGPGRCRVPGGRTGNWAYQLRCGSVSRDSLPAGNYELTLWAQSVQPPSVPGSGISTPAPEDIATAPDGWHQYRWRITCQANASFAISRSSDEPPVLIDEVRLYPVGAHMTSYTYDPVLGMTSQTDPSGRTATYEYDTLGRLLRMRDEQNRILNQQEYHYARP
jgi:YD repeat-containing protein